MSIETSSPQESAAADALGRVDEAVCALDDEWRFTVVNDRAAAILNHEPANLLDDVLWEVLPDVDDSDVGDNLREAMDTQESLRFDHYDESVGRWFEIRLYPSDDGVTVCFEDITDERGEQLNLQRQQRLFEAVFEETEDALVVADTDRRITYFNPAAEQLFGYNAGEVIGEKTEMLYADTTTANGKQQFGENATERSRASVVEYGRADGTTFEGETHGTSMEGPDGETLAFLCSIRDASVRIAYERKIERHNNVLRQFYRIVADEERTFDEQVESLLNLGRDHLSLDIGMLLGIDDKEFTVEHALGPAGTAEQGTQWDIDDTYQARVLKSDDLVTVTADNDTVQHPAYRGDSVESYIGVPVLVNGAQYGTLSFADVTARDESFTDSERVLVRLLGEWVGRELGRQQSRARATANRERLRQIIDTLPQLVFAKDSTGEFLLANEAIADAYGTTVEELEGAMDADFAESEAEARQFREDDMSVIESGERKVIPEEALTTADGERRVMQTTKIPYDPVDDETEAVLGVSTDITALKERDAEIRLQSEAMEVARDGIAILDDGEYVYMNQTHADIFGYDPEELVGSKWRQLYGDAEIERFESEVFPSISENGEWRGEAVGQKADGTPVHQDVGLSLLESGELICTNRDISEQKEREQELERQQTRLRALFDESPDDIIIHDEDGAVIDANDTQLETLGTDRETLLSKNVAEFEVGLTESELQELWAGMSVGEVLKTEGEHRRQNGDTFPVEVWVNKAEVDGNERYIAVSRDITERKKSKWALEEERDMFAQGPAVVFKWGNEEGWPVEYVSENVTETFGYTPDQLTSGTVPYTDLVHDDDIDRVAAEVNAQSDETTERFSHDPYRMVTDAGDVRWVTDNTKVIRDDGEITHYLGYLIDITEQKRLEQSVRESEQSLRELTDIASDTEQSFKEKLAALLELGRERLDVPYGFLNRIEDGTQHVVRAVGDHPKLQTGSEAPLSETYCRKTVQQDGVLGVHDAVEEGWEDDPGYDRFDLGCYVGQTVVVDGDRYGTLCFADRASRGRKFDETERAFVELLVQWISYELAGNAFETKLQEMNDTARRLMAARSRDEIAAITIESTKSVLDMSVNGIWWHDDAAEELVPAGMTEESDEVIPEQPALQRGASLAYDVFESGAVHTYDNLNEVDGLHNTETPLNSEITIPLGDHGVVSAGSVEPRAFSDTDQSLLKVLSATVEAALNRAQREETLRETQEKLKQSNEELEQFAYAASHDLQEPLRTVSSYLTLLERRYGDELDEDASEFIDFAVDGADRMRGMIQALLAYSRIDTQGQSFEPVAVDTLFDRLTQDLTVTIEETGAVVSTPTSDLTVSGDKDQLAQLFQNLVGNGIKYNDDQPRVDISATAQDEMVRFEVTDDGIGMDPDQTDDIFEVFQRLHTREEFDGTGIGLSLCRKIVDRHGGEIRVDSEPGVGTTFTLTLPQGGDDAE